MASAAVWLEKLGIPPREVCLDWAWQIQTHFASLPNSTGKDFAKLNWQRIEVSDTGELVLPIDLGHYSPEERLNELLSWAEGNLTSLNCSGTSPNHSGDWEKVLRELTLGAAVLPEDTPKPQINSGSETLQFASPPATLGSKRMRARAKVKTLNSKGSHGIFLTLKQHWRVASVALAILIMGCFIALNIGTGKYKSSKPDERAGELASAAPHSPELRRDKDLTDKGPELDDSASFDTLPAMPQFEVIEPEFRDLPQISMPSVLSAGLAGQESNRALSSAPVGSQGADQNIEVMPHDTKALGALEFTERDVMQELHALTESVANSPLESDMAVPDTEDSHTIAEPLMLRTSPMLQTQKLAAKIKVRPRRPVWQILLSVDDEFELTPNEPQTVTDRQITTWLLADSDDKDSQVRLVVQAQAAMGRQTALRWRIFGGAEDLPNLMLPLDKEILQPFQERLRTYSKMAQLEADRLRQLSSGAERDLRASLSKQRANLEAQLKLVSRLSTVVAKAQLLDDLLRSQLTVYAKLQDGTGSDAPTLLQFGDPRTAEKLDEASKPQVIAE